jgi:hypothetical protein
VIAAVEMAVAMRYLSNLRDGKEKIAFKVKTNNQYCPETSYTDEGCMEDRDDNAVNITKVTQPRK